jgi:hypothetical protein
MYIDINTLFTFEVSKSDDQSILAAIVRCSLLVFSFVFFFFLFIQYLLPLLALCVAYFRALRGFLPISFFVREKVISFFLFLPITLRCGSTTPILTVYFTPTRLVLCLSFCFFFTCTIVLYYFLYHH